jgi:hypothetical protein
MEFHFIRGVVMVLFAAVLCFIFRHENKRD